MKKKILVGILILAMLGFIIPSLFITNGKKGQNASSKSGYQRPTTVTKSDLAEPKFVDEGDLYFISEGKEIAKIDIEIANTTKQRMKGLMHRTFLENDRGMLFVFEQSARQNFWMKNTFIPLDIIFIDESGVILDMLKNVAPNTDVTEKPASASSNTIAKYVLEVNGGYVEAYGIKVGDEIKWNAH